MTRRSTAAAVHTSRRHFVMNLVYVSNQLSAGQVLIVFTSLQTRQSSCVVPHLVTDINLLMNCCWLWVLSPWSQLTLFAISASIWTDTDMSMGTHISKLLSSCFGILRQICCIHRSLTCSSLSTVITAFILSKVDYYNVTGTTRVSLQNFAAVRRNEVPEFIAYRH